MKKKIQLDISIKEKKWILVLLACIILFVAYQLGYAVLMNRTAINNKEIEELKSQVSALELMNKNKSMYSEGIEECNSKMDEIRGKFVKEETPEDNIMFIRNMEKNIGIEAYEINLYDKAMITNLTSDQSQTSMESTGEQTETTLDAQSNQSESQFVETGINYAVDMKFKCTYEQLKEMITYINEFPYIRVVQSVSVVFDADTGKLIGELTMNIYTLDEATNEYEKPSTGITSFGTDDIFGTIR